MEFNKKEGAAKYQLVGDKNPRIAAGSYNGFLADAPLAIVEGMFKRGNQYVTEKASPPPAGTKPGK